jgi:multisubunit Na+/H+ antiporter MnhC subunit
MDDLAQRESSKRAETQLLVALCAGYFGLLGWLVTRLVGDGPWTAPVVDAAVEQALRSPLVQGLVVLAVAAGLGVRAFMIRLQRTYRLAQHHRAISLRLVDGNRRLALGLDSGADRLSPFFVPDSGDDLADWNALDAGFGEIETRLCFGRLLLLGLSTLLLMSTVWLLAFLGDDGLVLSAASIAVSVYALAEVASGHVGRFHRTRLVAIRRSKPWLRIDPIKFRQYLWPPRPTGIVLLLAELAVACAPLAAPYECVRRGWSVSTWQLVAGSGAALIVTAAIVGALCSLLPAEWRRSDGAGTRSASATPRAPSSDPTCPTCSQPADDRPRGPVRWLFYRPTAARVPRND